MTRGKYGARAANRIVQTDNELLKAKAAEVEVLKAELSAARAELNAERVRTSREIHTVAEEKAAAQVAAVKAEAKAEVARLTEEMHTAADEITDIYRDFVRKIKEFSPDGRCFPASMSNHPDDDEPSLLRVFRRLSPDKAGEYVAHIFVVGTPDESGWIPGVQGRQARRRSAGALANDLRERQASERKRVLKRLADSRTDNTPVAADE